VAYNDVEAGQTAALKAKCEEHGAIGTYADFEVLARKNGLTILDGFGLRDGEPVRFWPNARASTAVFKFERR